MDAQQMHPGFLAAVERFGTQAELARACGITPQSITECKRAGFSAATALRIEQLTGGALRALDLVRADVLEPPAARRHPAIAR